MLIDSGLPNIFWVYAAEYSTQIFNSLPTTTKSGFMSPIQAKYGMVPSVTHFRRFGCLCYCHIPAATREKGFVDKSYKSYFLGIDKTIFIGNYPISTSIWSTEQENELLSLANKMRGLNPSYYIGIRNLLPHRHPTLISNLKSLGYFGIPSRVIYEFDLRCKNSSIPSHLKRDLALLKKLNLDVEICSKLDQDSLLRIHDLYQKIYLHKHSLLNPQYTVQFFDDVVNQGVMSCLLVRGPDQQVYSFALLLSTGHTLSVPALGYDTQLNLEGSYRVLFAAIYTYAKDQRLLLNYSSGAGDFKRKRGGIAYLEYTYLTCPFNSYDVKRFILVLVAKKTASLKAQDLIELGA
jgi:hypothetical protein